MEDIGKMIIYWGRLSSFRRTLCQKGTWQGFPAFGAPANAIFTIRPGGLITSAEGKQLQQKVWSEIVDELKTKVPEVEGLASSPL